MAAVPEPTEAAEAQRSEPISFDRILLTILDSNPYLNDSSRQAIGMAAELARLHSGKVTVLVVDSAESQADPTVKLQTISRYCSSCFASIHRLMKTTCVTITIEQHRSSPPSRPTSPLAPLPSKTAQ